VLSLYKTELTSLPEAITSLLSLRHLHLHENPFESLPEPLEEWIDELKKKGCFVSREETGFTPMIPPWKKDWQEDQY